MKKQEGWCQLTSGGLKMVTLFLPVQVRHLGLVWVGYAFLETGWETG